MNQKRSLSLEHLQNLPFTNLRHQSGFSLGKAIGTVEPIVKRAVEVGQRAVAIVDDNSLATGLTLYNHVRNPKTLQKLGVDSLVPVMGTELKFKSQGVVSSIVLIAKNQTGYGNLCRLLAMASEKEYDHLDLDEVLRLKEGLICLQGSIESTLGFALLNRPEKAQNIARLFKSEFGEDFYLEVSLKDHSKEWDHDLGRHLDIVDDPQIKINKGVLELSRTLNIKALLTLNSSTMKPSNFPAQKIAILSSNAMNEKKRGKSVAVPVPHVSNHMMSISEAYDVVKEKHDYIDDETFVALATNTDEVVEKVKTLELFFKPILPSIDYANHPIHSTTAEEKLKELQKSPKFKTLHGLLKDRTTSPALDLVLKIALTNEVIPWEEPKYQARLLEEINLFNDPEVNFLDYFLIPEDVSRFIVSEGGTASVGRGSGAGVLLAYALGIQHLDPVFYKLNLERFGTKEKFKISMPDYDYDTADRDGSKGHLVRKFGLNHTMLIGTFQTHKLKGAIKDTLRYMKPLMKFEEVNALTKKVDAVKFDPEEHNSELEYFQDVLEHEPTLRAFFNKEAEVFETVSNLLGNPKSMGIHAGGIVISSVDPRPLIPAVWNSKENMWITGVSMEAVEQSGLIKYDFLGLKNLKQVQRCFDLIKKRHQKTVSFANIPHDDSKVLKEFQQGNTTSIFQFNTNLATGILKQMNSVDSILDLALITAVGRPGPLKSGIDKELIGRKNGTKEITYPHELVKPILEESYGLIIYQEQILLITQLFGFSKDDSTRILKAMSKKVREKVEAYKTPFVEGAIKKGLDESVALDLWQKMEAFAEYGFNKSHACAYAFLSYVCMYLKTHYSVEWIASVLEEGDKDDFKTYYSEWKHFIQKPDVNLSKTDYLIDHNKFVMPISAINGVGEKATEEIVKNQPYASLEDFFSKIDSKVVNKRSIMPLIYAGAFDGFIDGADKVQGRIGLFTNYYAQREKIKKLTKAEREDRDAFIKELQTLGPSNLVVKELAVLNFASADYHELFEDKFKITAKKLFGQEASAPHTIDDRYENETIVLGGCVKEVRELFVKSGFNKGKKMLKIVLSDSKADVEITVFNKLLEKKKSLETLSEYSCIAVKGKVNVFNGVKGLLMDDYIKFA